jgi:hypothetical protein
VGRKVGWPNRGIAPVPTHPMIYDMVRSPK